MADNENAALRAEIARIVTSVNNHHEVFGAITAAWEEEINEIKGLKTHAEIQDALSKLLNGLRQARRMGLINLHDALLPPVENTTPAAIGGSLTTPVTAESVTTTPKGEVLIAGKPVSDIVPSVTTTPP